MAVQHRDQQRRNQQKRKRGVPAAPVQKEEQPEGAQLIVDCKYKNELPLPPVPKLLRALPSIERLCQYQPTSLELDYRPFLLSERELLSRVELVEPDAYGEAPAAGSMPPPPPPLDSQLLKDDDVTEEVREAEKKKRRLYEETEAWHRQAFGLQLPQLITNDVFTERQRFTTGLNATEKKMYREPPGFKDVEELGEKIEASFDAARAAPVHPTKPHLKAKRIMPIVPDAVLWANKYQQVVFDEQPPGHEVTRHDLLFRSTPDPRTTCFGFYAPPSQEEAGETGTYKLAQNYFWDNRGGFTKASDVGEGETILLSVPVAGAEGAEGASQDEEIRFIMIPTAIKLRKQKAFRLDIAPEVHALNVAFREPSAQEVVEEQERMNVVLSEEVTRDRSEASLDYVEGEWQIRGDPRSTRSASGRSRQASSQHGGSQYYKTVDGVKYDRKLLEKAEAFANDGQISSLEAQQLWDQAKEGPGITRTGKKTLEYILNSLQCTKPAQDFLREKLAEVAAPLPLAASPFAASPLAASPAPPTI
eukprot:gb/GFBE01041118.1/.p1 GENE.gb/GFBE01041118.1/~~gb/GFBE01041118.1/.p1  ORF type:complete len:532 (+),score=147.31 gb/GFBE01041118.1/:1-1596(+)